MASKVPTKAPVKTPAKEPAKAVATAPRKVAVKTAVVAPKRVAVSKPAPPLPVAAQKAVIAPVKPAPAPATVAAPKEKLKKPKLVRDSFTMPEAEYQALADLKKACIKAGFEVKKSELLRIGVALMQRGNVAQLKQVLATLPPLKAGRPRKAK